MKNIDGSVAFQKDNTLVYRFVIDVKPEYAKGLFTRDPISGTMILNKPAKISTTVANKPARTATKSVKRRSISMASTRKREDGASRSSLLEPLTISSSDKLDDNKSSGRCQACSQRKKKCDGRRLCQYCVSKDEDCVDEEDRPGKRRRLGS